MGTASGLPPVTAEARAAKAALRYAGKQHRERADMIVNTELAFAYNRGADIGIKRAIKDGFMGRCEMVWTTAGTNRVCGRCLALKDKVVGHTDEDGVTLPPLHPRCRCAIMYREVEALKVSQSSSRMSAEDVPKWPPQNKANVIPKEEYAKLRSLAEANGIALSGVKKFDGSAHVMRETIETLSALQEKFPVVRNEKYPLTLNISRTMGAEDFAITHGKIISLNENAYRDVNLLAAEYKKAMENGWFVKGTTWRAIIHHEFGHVVDEIYKLDGLKIACEITGLKPKETLAWLKKNLSVYAGSFSDGGEIISEVFADISTGSPNDFSHKFYDKLLELVRR